MFPTNLFKVSLSLQCNTLPETGSKEASAFQKKAERVPEGKHQWKWEGHEMASVKRVWERERIAKPDSGSHRTPVWLANGSVLEAQNGGGDEFVWGLVKFEALKVFNSGARCALIREWNGKRSLQWLRWPGTVSAQLLSFYCNLEVLFFFFFPISPPFPSFSFKLRFYEIWTCYLVFRGQHLTHPTTESLHGVRDSIKVLFTSSVGFRLWCSHRLVCCPCSYS